MTGRFVALWLIVVLTNLPAQAQAPDNSFNQLLQETGMEIAMPARFKAIKARPNPVFPFDRIWRDKTAGMEIRIAVRPLARMQIEYNDPHSSAPNPEHVYPLVFQSLVGQLSRGGAMPTRAWPADKAKKLFNADWASAALFDADPMLNSPHKNALLLAFHRAGIGDGYVLVLFSNVPSAKPDLDKVLTVLRFRDPLPDKTMPAAN